MVASRWLLVLLPLAGFGVGFAAAYEHERPPVAAPSAPAALIRAKPQVIPAVAPMRPPPPLIARPRARLRSAPVRRVSSLRSAPASAGVSTVMATGAAGGVVAHAGPGVSHARVVSPKRRGSTGGAAVSARPARPARGAAQPTR